MQSKIGRRACAGWCPWDPPDDVQYSIKTPELTLFPWTPLKGDNSPREVSDDEAATIHQRVQTRSGPALEILRAPGGRGGPRVRPPTQPSLQVADGTRGP